RSGLTVRTISDLERGEKGHPRRDTLQMLEDALRLDVPERTLFRKAARGLEPEPPPAPKALISAATDPPPNTLPVFPTPLIDRERERARARKLLLRPDVRLLTVTGPGGIGKTQLTSQVAREMLPSFADEVFSIGLSSIKDPVAVAPAIAETL